MSESRSPASALIVDDEQDIRELLVLSTDRERGVKSVKKRAEARLDQVNQRIHELQRMKRGLQQLIDACPGHGPLEHCPILRALGGEETHDHA